MIRSFACADTARVFDRLTVRRFPSNVLRIAHRKLWVLHHAAALRDLASPPGNRLELLSGDRAGQHSIRINRQFRICFVWNSGHAYEVQIIDYH